MHHFNGITWQIAVGAVVVAVLAFALGFYMGKQSVPVPQLQQTQQEEQVQEETAVVETPDLTTKSVRGTYTGYFKEVERPDWEGTSTCSTFVILSGNEEVIQHFTDMIEIGNTVNTLTSTGKLQVNLPDDVPSSARAAIEASSASSPITLELIKDPQEGKGASACSSFFSFGRIVD